MSFETTPSEIIYSSGATGEADLRLIHYNDVYHIEGGCVLIPFSSCPEADHLRQLVLRVQELRVSFRLSITTVPATTLRDSRSC